MIPRHQWRIITCNNCNRHSGIMNTYMVAHLRLSVIGILTTVIIFLLRFPLSANELKSITISTSPEKARLVLQFASNPQYQFWMSSQPASLSVLLPDCSCGEGLPLSGKRKDSLVYGWSVKEENWRRVNLDLQLNYDLPDENVTAMTLKDPPRLVIDFKKSYSREFSSALTPNISWHAWEKAWSLGYVLINEISFSLKNVDLKVVQANDSAKSRETTTSMAVRYQALAAINGGFFANSGGPLGLVYLDGKVLSQPVKTRPPRTGMALTDDKRVIIDTLISEGNDVRTVKGRTLKGLQFAIACGPRLIENGEVKITADEEGLGKKGNDITRRAGRTAVSVDKKGRVSLFTVSGFHENHNSGMKLDEMAELLRQRGAWQAFCLDGGHSTAMVLLGTTVSRARGNKVPERKVANSLIVSDRDASFHPYHIDVQCSTREIPANGRSYADFAVTVRDSRGKAVPDGTLVFFLASNGKVTSPASTRKGVAKGRLYSVPAAGDVSLTAQCGCARSDMVTIRFYAGAPSQLSLRLRPIRKEKDSAEDNEKPAGIRKNEEDAGRSEIERYLVDALVEDEYSNPLSGKDITFEVFEAGAVIGTKTVKTSGNGVATIEVANIQKSTEIRISTESLKPERQKLPQYISEKGH